MDEAELDLFRKHAETCCIFCNEKRLMIMWTLGDGEKSVGEISKKLGVPSQTVSQHLRLMKDRGVVAYTRRGRHMFYRLANPKFLEAHKIIRCALIENSK